MRRRDCCLTRHAAAVGSHDHDPPALPARLPRLALGHGAGPRAVRLRLPTVRQGPVDQRREGVRFRRRVTLAVYCDVCGRRAPVRVERSEIEAKRNVPPDTPVGDVKCPRCAKEGRVVFIEILARAFHEAA